MKKPAICLIMAGALGVGGCTAMDDGYGSYGYNSRYAPVGYGAGYYGQGGPSLAEAAAEACSYHAQQRYGRAQVGTVQQVGRDTMRVYGTLDMNRSYERRPFACSYRNDGRITDFDID